MAGCGWAARVVGCLAPPSAVRYEAALREVISSPQSPLPPHLSLLLLAKPACSDDEIGSILAGFGCSDNGVANVGGALVPRRPLVRELALTLHRWARLGRLPWPHPPPVPDMSEVPLWPADRLNALTERVRSAARDTGSARGLLDELSCWGVLALLRLRRSGTSRPLPPPEAGELINSFCVRHSSCAELTVGARALSKHCHRSASGFWGSVHGNDRLKNQHALRVLLQLLQTAVWINVFDLPRGNCTSDVDADVADDDSYEGAGAGIAAENTVFELRQAEGYGARWSADGRRFRGFVEPHGWDVARRVVRGQVGQSPAGDAAADAKPAGAVASERNGAAAEEPTAVKAAAAASCAAPAEGARLETVMASRSSPLDGDFVTICGYASLLDVESARAETPSMRNFRLGWVSGYCRVFNLVSIINLRRGRGRGRLLTSCTAIPRAGCSLRVALYDVPVGELPSLLQREARLQPRWVRCADDAGDAQAEALAFVASSDAAYFREICGGDESVYRQYVGQFYEGRLYRDDLLPVPAYVLRCLGAHQKAGPVALANFLDMAFLGDGRSLREYLNAEMQRSCCAMPSPPSSESVWNEEELDELRSRLRA